MPLSVLDQARSYLSKMPSAISGSDGHGQTYCVAMTLLEGFGLTVSEARPLMQEYSVRCQPPWSEREIEHKLADADRKKEPGKVGKLLRQGVRWKLRGYSNPPPPPKAAPAPKSVAPAGHYEVPDTLELPEPMADGAREFLRAVFNPGEGIRICVARLGEDGREVPKDGGITLTREEWLRKLDQHDGKPNGFLKTSQKNGIFVSVNPMRLGGTKDDDVTAYRCALLEFDKISQVEQFGLITQSGVPCAAVISSGNKSIHAWVKVDAKDRQEFDERVKLLYGHFAAYQPDEKNKNPSRFSRLPFCERGSRRQELLALNTGSPSWLDWQKKIEGDALGKCETFAELMALDTANDPNCVIGFRDGRTLRYLCRGKSAWLLGPSGIGKSSLVSEFAIAWALGKPAFGITPSKALRSVIVQAENDRYDLAEMVQGIARSHELKENSDELSQVNELVRFKTETRATGINFIERLQKLIDRERPDVVWIDPLLSFAGIEVNRQDQVTMFLREHLTPVLETTGVVLIGVHHTGKPKSAKETSHWTTIDWAYAGLGSSELVNWARAVMLLHPLSDHEFELKLAKRGRRAGATHPDGEFATSIFLQHAARDIRWEQTAPPEQPEPETAGDKKRTKTAELAASNLHEIMAAIPAGGESANALGKRLHLLSRKRHNTIGLTTCRTTLLDLLVENGKIAFDPATERYSKGPNA